MNDFSPIRPYCQSLVKFAERYHLALLTMLIIATSSTACLNSVTRPFWFDEVLTAQISSLESSSIWQALYSVCDTNPPLYYFIVKACRTIFSNVELAVRFPSIIGSILLLSGIFLSVRTHTSKTVALFATAILPLTIAPKYLQEGRPYGLVLGLATFAYYFWQQTGTQNRKLFHYIGFSVTLTLLIGIQYYAGLVFIPLAAGEVVRILQRRRIDSGIALGFMLATFPLLLSLPLIEQLGSLIPGYWSKVGAAESIYHSYGYIFGSALIPIACISVIIFAVLIAFRLQAKIPIRLVWPLPEIVATTCFVLLPVIGVILSQAGTGIFTSRYALPAVLGMGLSAGICLSCFKNRASDIAVIGLLACIPFLATISFSSWKTLSSEGVRMASPVEHETASSLSTVFTDGLQFLPQSYYLNHLDGYDPVYVSSPARSVAATGSDTNDRILLANARLFPLRVLSPADFFESTNEFILVGDSGWILPYLKEAGAKIQPLPATNGYDRRQVSLPNHPE